MNTGTVAVALALCTGSLVAQGYRDFLSPSYRDLEVVRNRPLPFTSAITVRGGIAGTLASKDEPAFGQENGFAADGFVWYHTDRFTSGGSKLDAYAGRDGAIVSLRDDQLSDSGGGRIELSSRYFPFYREGFYQSGDWIPTGRYEGTDYTVYGGLNTALGEGAMLEFGPYYRFNTFARSDATAEGYTIPDDYDAYGGRFYFEQGTLQLDRQSGLPNEGFLATIRVDYERNTGTGKFGTPLWTSTLPDTFWRGTMHLEWYFPAEGGGAWEVRVDAGLADSKDRVYIYDAQKPIGYYWGDGTLGFRFDLGELHLTPYGQLQYTRTADERGEGSSSDIWFGGGLRARFDIGDAVSALADYSYVNNPNRPSISYNEDTYGEQQFFVGVEVRFGATRY